MLTNAWLVLTIVASSQTKPIAPAATCAECGADMATIRTQIVELRAESRHGRVAAARQLGQVGWRCHPEAVTALVDALRTDPTPRVRGAAAEALGRMVPNVPTSHLALLGAMRSDPSNATQNQARKALAAKGLRCVTDCPICGPLPTGAATTGPSLRWPQWDHPTRDPTSSLPDLPPALPADVQP